MGGWAGMHQVLPLLAVRLTQHVEHHRSLYLRKQSHVSESG